MKPPQNNFGIIRLLLAMLVMLGHFKVLPGDPATEWVFGYADFAVDAFFIISGYLVFGSYDRQPLTLSFYIRRLFRIYPLYCLVVILQGFGMAILAGGIVTHSHELLHYLACNLVFANFLAPGLGTLLNPLHNHGINPSLWTLKIEVAFYLIVPLLWLLVRRFGLWFLVFVYIASTLYVVAAIHYSMDDLARQLPGKLRFFILGIAFYRYRDSLPVPLPYAIIGSVLLFAFCAMRSKVPPEVLPVYPLCVGLLVFVCAMRLPAIPITFDISYGIYLLHGPFIQFALLLHMFRNTGGFLCIMLVCVCGLACLAERFIEQPAIDWGHRIASRWPRRQKDQAA